MSINTELVSVPSGYRGLHRGIAIEEMSLWGVRVFKAHMSFLGEEFHGDSIEEARAEVDRGLLLQRCKHASVQAALTSKAEIGDLIAHSIGGPKEAYSLTAKSADRLVLTRSDGQVCVVEHGESLAHGAVYLEDDANSRPRYRARVLTGYEQLSSDLLAYSETFGDRLV